MSSTDQTPDAQSLASFFANQFTPLAEQLKAEHINLLQLTFDDAEESWYVPYPTDAEELVTFDGSRLEDELRNLWEGEGLHQLADLATQIGELAARLESDTSLDNEDVSPFIYVMF